MPDSSRAAARRRNRDQKRRKLNTKREVSWDGVPRRLYWLKVRNARGQERGLAGTCIKILSYLSTLELQHPERRVRGPDNVIYHRISIRALARRLGRRKSASWVCVCLGKLCELGLLERRDTVHFIRDDRYPFAKEYHDASGRRRQLGVRPRRGVSLTRFKYAGRKICGMPLLDVDGHFGRSLAVPKLEDRPVYTGRGAWGRRELAPGASIFELWRERMPGALQRSQLTLADFQADDQAEHRSGAPPPS